MLERPNSPQSLYDELLNNEFASTDRESAVRRKLFDLNFDAYKSISWSLESIDIENFKSIKQSTITIDDVGFLSGLNSSGKSSYTQIFLLLVQWLSGQSTSQVGTVPLNGELISLGRASDVLSEFSSEGDFEIRVTLNYQSTYKGKDQKRNKKSVSFILDTGDHVQMNEGDIFYIKPEDGIQNNDPYIYIKEAKVTHELFSSVDPRVTTEFYRNNRGSLMREASSREEKSMIRRLYDTGASLVLESSYRAEEYPENKEEKLVNKMKEGSKLRYTNLPIFLGDWASDDRLTGVVDSSNFHSVPLYTDRVYIFSEDKDKKLLHQDFSLTTWFPENIQVTSATPSRLRTGVENNYFSSHGSGHWFEDKIKKELLSDSVPVYRNDYVKYILFSLLTQSIQETPINIEKDYEISDLITEYKAVFCHELRIKETLLGNTVAIDSSLDYLRDSQGELLLLYLISDAIRAEFPLPQQLPLDNDSVGNVDTSIEGLANNILEGISSEEEKKEAVLLGGLLIALDIDSESIINFEDNINLKRRPGPGRYAEDFFSRDVDSFTGVRHLDNPELFYDLLTGKVDQNIFSTFSEDSLGRERWKPGEGQSSRIQKMRVSQRGEYFYSESIDFIPAGVSENLNVILNELRERKEPSREKTSPVTRSLLAEIEDDIASSIKQYLKPSASEVEGKTNFQDYLFGRGDVYSSLIVSQRIPVPIKDFPEKEKYGKGIDQETVDNIVNSSQYPTNEPFPLTITARKIEEIPDAKDDTNKRKDKEHKLEVVDGRNKLEAARQLGFTEIMCEINEPDPMLELHEEELNNLMSTLLKSIDKESKNISSKLIKDSKEFDIDKKQFGTSVDNIINDLFGKPKEKSSNDRRPSLEIIRKYILLKLILHPKSTVFQSEFLRESYSNFFFTELDVDSKGRLTKGKSQGSQQRMRNSGYSAEAREKHLKNKNIIERVLDNPDIILTPLHLSSSPQPVSIIHDESFILNSVSFLNTSRERKYISNSYGGNAITPLGIDAEHTASYLDTYGNEEYKLPNTTIVSEVFGEGYVDKVNAYFDELGYPEETEIIGLDVGEAFFGDHFYEKSILLHLSDWLSYILGEQVSVAVSTGDFGGASLKISQYGKQDRIMRNVGSGVNQVIPVILSILIGGNKVLFLEEIEQNLHPGAQARLADMIMTFAHVNNIKIIVETHSEHLLNRLRLNTMILNNVPKLVQDRRDNFSVYFTSLDDVHGTRLSKMEIDSYGRFAVEEFPEGFFDQAQIDTMKILKEANKRKEKKDKEYPTFPEG